MPIVGRRVEAVAAAADARRTVWQVRRAARLRMLADDDRADREAWAESAGLEAH